MKRQYVILTGGDGGYGNLGDEWLLDATLGHYGKIKEKYKVIVLMAKNKNSRNKDFEYIEDNPDVFKKRKIPINRITAVHYYGGGYLNNYWMEEKLWLYDYLVNSGFSKSNFFFTGLGLGPLTSDRIDILKSIASSARFFGIRDECFSKEIGGNFMFDESVFLAENKRRFFYKKNELWVNFRIASHVGADETKILKLIGQLERFAQIHRLKIKYFAMINGDGFDEKTEFERLLRKSGIESQVLDRVDNYDEFLSQFKYAAMVVTTSYHATLAALYNALPVIAVYENEYYSLKFLGLSESLDTPLLTTLNLADYDVDQIQNSLDQKDKSIKTKINKLKLLNKQAYLNLYDFLNIK